MPKFEEGKMSKYTIDRRPQLLLEVNVYLASTKTHYTSLEVLCPNLCLKGEWPIGEFDHPQPNAPNEHLLCDTYPVSLLLKHDRHGACNTPCKGTLPSSCLFPHPYLMSLSCQR